jgi:RHS repeat-associated protein
MSETSAFRPALERALNHTTASSTPWQETFTFDADGNRLSQGGSYASSFTISPTSNRITATSGYVYGQLGYDVSGNVTGVQQGTATYSASGRMAIATNAAAGISVQLIYNAIGQRIHKSSPLGNTQFVYDEARHLLGEYDDAGNLIEEMVRLGDIPVATLRPNGSGGIATYYVHTDHLNTPRKISRSSDNGLVWRGDSDPFENTPFNDNPSGLGTFVSNLGFPGQYFDVETNLYENGARYYDPAASRYFQSDPIGLRGGVNTYAYVGGNPLSFADPLGLWSTPAHNAIIQTAFPDLWVLNIEAIEDGSASVDALFNQGSSTAYQHAMRAPTQNPAEAKRLMCKFIKDNLQEYKRLMNSHDGRDEWLAYQALGRALHPIMDSTSPAHIGWQVWDNPILDPAEILQHGSLPSSIEDMKDLTPELMRENIQLIKNAMSGNIPCGCDN